MPRPDSGLEMVIFTHLFEDKFLVSSWNAKQSKCILTHGRFIKGVAEILLKAFTKVTYFEVKQDI